MRDYTSAYPEVELLEIYISTTSDKIAKVQAFWKGTSSARHLYCPEFGTVIYTYYDSFEAAKRAMISQAEDLLRHVDEKIRRIKDLKEND